MKQVFYSLIAASLILSGCNSGTTTEGNSDDSASETTEEGVFKNGIQWGSTDETASWLSMEGVYHWSNVEMDKAFILWDHSIQRDSTQFAVHTMLSLMTNGERSEYHKSMAKKYVQDKNETSKLFVSLLDLRGTENAQEKGREIWAKLHEMSNGPFIHFVYARTLGTEEDQSAAIAELEKVIAVCTENEVYEIAAAAMNFKAYLLEASGDHEGAVAAADKYYDMYAGYNAKDTRAEMYLMGGDTTNAIKWYEAALEHYPFAQSAREALEDLKKSEE